MREAVNEKHLTSLFGVCNAASHRIHGELAKICTPRRSHTLDQAPVWRLSMRKTRDEIYEEIYGSRRFRPMAAALLTLDERHQRLASCGFAREHWHDLSKIARNVVVLAENEADRPDDSNQRKASEWLRKLPPTPHWPDGCGDFHEQRRLSWRYDPCLRGSRTMTSDESSASTSGRVSTKNNSRHSRHPSCPK